MRQHIRQNTLTLRTYTPKYVKQITSTIGFSKIGARENAPSEYNLLGNFRLTAERPASHLPRGTPGCNIAKTADGHVSQTSSLSKILEWTGPPGEGYTEI